MKSAFVFIIILMDCIMGDNSLINEQNKVNINVDIGNNNNGWWAGNSAQGLAATSLTNSGRRSVNSAMQNTNAQTLLRMQQGGIQEGYIGAPYQTGVQNYNGHYANSMEGWNNRQNTNWNANRNGNLNSNSNNWNSNGNNWNRYGGSSSSWNGNSNGNGNNWNGNGNGNNWNGNGNGNGNSWNGNGNSWNGNGNDNSWNGNGNGNNWNGNGNGNDNGYGWNGNGYNQNGYGYDNGVYNGAGTTSQTCQASLNTDQVTQLTCPSGTLISNVIAAAYGQNPGSCAAGAATVNSYCTLNVTATVERICFNSNTCSVTLTTNVLGQPQQSGTQCSSTGNALVATYICSVPGFSTVNNGLYPSSAPVSSQISMKLYAVLFLITLLAFVDAL